MTDVTLRATKGSPLTHTEMDNNQVATRSGRKNMVIGGNFDTNPFQRGTAFTAVSNNDVTADRIKWVQSGSAVVDHDKVADAPSVAQAGFLVSNCLSLDVTTADASIASGDQYSISHRLEGYDYAHIAQNDFVLTFWHKHTKTGTYCVGLRNSGFDRSFVSEYTQSVSDTWEKATIAVTASPVAGTWDYTNGIGLNIGFTMAAGTTFHTTADAWNTGSFLATSSQVNAADSASNFMRFALIQVEEGIEATDFERRHVAEELALCQRYFEKSFDIDDAPGANTNAGATIFNSVGTAPRFSVAFLTAKRSAPTIVGYNPNTSAIGTWRDSIAGANRTFTSADFGHRGFKAVLVGCVDLNRMEGHWTADAEL